MSMAKDTAGRAAPEKKLTEELQVALTRLVVSSSAVIDRCEDGSFRDVFSSSRGIVPVDGVDIACNRLIAQLSKCHFTMAQTRVDSAMLGEYRPTADDDSATRLHGFLVDRTEENRRRRVAAAGMLSDMDEL